MTNDYITLAITVAAWLLYFYNVIHSRHKHGPIAQETLSLLFIFFGIGFLLIADLASILAKAYPRFDYSFLNTEPWRPNIFRACLIVAGLFFIFRWRKRK